MEEGDGVYLPRMLRHISAACRIIYEMASSAAAGSKKGREKGRAREGKAGGSSQYSMRCGSL